MVGLSGTQTYLAHIKPQAGFAVCHGQLQASTWAQAHSGELLEVNGAKTGARLSLNPHEVSNRAHEGYLVNPVA